MEYLKKLGLGLVVAAAVIGYKFYSKSSAKTEVREQLQRICEKDAECLGSVEQHFESCFEQHYKLGGRRRAGGLDQSAMVSCINGRAGKPLFSVSEE
ncbi:hypothetical protein JY651_29830 [Pyxidicoccus parkwayensis]|uniref:Uncharacterized protein n=1 Tax=Pyxidicoccus parkwayensis TaxID=2813578 RepID=A0ABX7NM49_9BACT|nr:hypothetical protein [Pyxidicoccus parkwaysis]QSQ19506.1 hypothetical protein JY651_29830 [Pyxidicoccus parkwaysis]